MVLLCLLVKLAVPYRSRLMVAHFNHQFRGRSSDADERRVRRTAKKLGLRFVSGRADVRKFARGNKLSVEMAARELRHAFLARTARRHGIKTIALAHHADDQVELFFLRLLRGAGGEGLAGMKWLGRSPADSGIALARPLLDQPKSALAAFAKEHRVPFREDATNAQLDFQRNRIRRELLPLLTKHYQPALARVVLRQMEIIGAESEAVNAVAADWLRRRADAKFSALPVAVQRRCLQLQLARHGLKPNFDLIEQLREKAGRPVTVNEKLYVCRDEAGRVAVQKAGRFAFNANQLKVRLKGRTGRVAFENARIFWKVRTAPAGTFRAPKHKVNGETLDLDKLGSDIVLRHWRRGDRFQPLGMPKPVKLQDLFTNEKVAREQRHRLLVGATGSGELFWVEGLRLGERFKLDKSTRYQLHWRWKRLCCLGSERKPASG